MTSPPEKPGPPAADRTVVMPASGPPPPPPVVDDVSDTQPCAPPEAGRVPTVIEPGAAGRPRAPSGIGAGTPLGGRYTVTREIGQGGMGTVLEGWDTAIGRPVALKIMRGETEVPPEIRERFLHEAEVTGRLEHPNIVPVHDLGQAPHPQTGVPQAFFCMKLIEGEDLLSVIQRLASGDEEARKAFSRTRLLQIFQDICMGIAFAHDRGVIHRDLKPGNVMIGRYGETLIVDWGLAKVKGQGTAGDRALRSGPATVPRHPESTQLTLDGEILGTPAYMSPEQATGRLGQVDERSDIYSLGAILYEMLVYRPPFEGDDPMQVVRSVAAGEVIPPSQKIAFPAGRASEAAECAAEAARVGPASPPARGGAPGDTPARAGGTGVELEWIVLRAMAKDPADRYPTARQLHDEIQLYLEGVKEQERRRDLARVKVEEGRGVADRLAGLRERIAQGETAAKKMAEETRPWHPIERKRALWRAEDGIEQLRNELLDTFSAANGAFTAALSIDPSCAEARAGKAALFWDRFAEAEAAGNAEQMRINRVLVEQYDDGSYAERLKGDGTLSVRTRRYPCGCLKDEGGVGGDAGASTGPATAFRRHRSECVPVPLIGVHIFLYAWREVDRRLVPARPTGVAGPGGAAGKMPTPAAQVDGLPLSEAQYLGPTPLEGVRIPMGRYLLLLVSADGSFARVPLHITRLRQESIDVTLFSPDEIGGGFIHIPAGPVVYGGDAVALQPVRQVFDVPDFFIARFPVTAGEYLEFLNDLVRTHPDEAARRVPRTETQAGYLWPRGADGRYALPGPEGPLFPGASGPQPWDARQPITCVSGEDAAAFAAWSASRQRRFVALPREEEWEKTARGCDGRIYPWGDRFDASFCNGMETHEKGGRVLPVGAMATDESPYGVRDLAGNARDWCRNMPQPSYHEWRAIRGGACMLAGQYLHSAYRFAGRPATVHIFNGFRLVAYPVADPSHEDDGPAREE
ncbi:MAG: SUMF1/EgtB/PvdO family nonheme iron enzyme [Planctomycetes bacterium]|nr:SUMF1/EgtB/PvdO family nonheme iron enzyme [Planctomycetota bacterium]